MNTAITSIQLRAFIWLLLACLITALCATQFIGKQIPLETDLLALLPSTERNPIAEKAVKKLASTTSNRAIFLIGHQSSKLAARAARNFANDLRSSQAFKNVTAETPPIDPTQLTALYAGKRFFLLSDADRIALSQDNINLEARLQQKLFSPFSFGLTLPIQDDPFGFTDAWLANLPLKNLNLSPNDGLLVTEGSDADSDNKLTWVFVSANLKGSAYDNDSQQHVINAVTHAEVALYQNYPKTKLLRTGAVFYAEAARSRAEHEINIIGSGSLIGMLLLLYFTFRSIRPLALGLLSVSFGIATALLVTIYTFGKIHLITLIFGASLIGEAIDYAIQYFAAHLGAGKNWHPITGLRRVAPGLTIALATSLLGYSALTFSPFPALTQIGLFALIGLSSACFSAFMLLPAMLTKASKRDARTTVVIPQRLLAWWQAHISKRTCYILMVLLLVLATPGWLALYSDDDVHLLISKSKTLASQEQSIRQLTGIGNSSQFFLIEGASVNEVLMREEALYKMLTPLVAQGEISAYQGISAFVPSLDTQIQNRVQLQTKVFADETKLNTIFEHIGMRDDVSKQQLIAFKKSARHHLLLDDWLESPISLPFRHLWLGETSHGYAAIGLPLGIHQTNLISHAAEGLAGVTMVDKAASASQILQKYRQWSAYWLMGVICLVYGILCIRYRGWQAAVILFPTVLAITQVLSFFGYAHIPITLFNMLGLMLVLGVGVNYAIFLYEGGVNAAAALTGVLLSAGTTLISFGLLSFSSMPALSNFGLTLLIGVGIAVLLTPIVLVFKTNPRSKKLST